MALPRQEVSAEAATDVLVDFVREHSGSARFKEFASAIGYRTWFFAPQKKLRLFEEMFFLHSALALASINNVQADRSTRVYTKTLFQYKLQKQLGSFLSKDDPTFAARRTQNTHSYTSLLTSGGDVIGLSSTFLAQLYGAASSSLNLKASMGLLPVLLATQNLINEVAASMVVQAESEDEPSDF